MNKKELRKFWIEELKITQMPSAQDVKKIICNNSLIEKANNIFAYIPFKTEINIKDSIDELLKTKKVFLPICFKERILKFCEIDQQWKNNLERTENKTLIPKNKEITPLTKIKGLTIILIPGLAFNKEKYRLGRGGGYYDTLLEKLKDNSNFYSVGLCMEKQVITDFSPDSFDRPVDELIII